MMSKEQAVPVIFILLYLMVTMILGLLPYGRKRVDTLHSFHLASGDTNALMLILCVMATLYTGSTWTAWVGMTEENGLFVTYVIPYIAIAGILYYFTAQKVYILGRQKEMFTMGSLMADRFSGKGPRVITAALSFGIGSVWVMMEIITLGYVINAVFGNRLNSWVAYLLGFLIILVYILWGGLESILWTDCFQGSLTMLGGIAICAILVSYYFGDPSNLMRAFMEKGNNTVIFSFQEAPLILNNLRKWSCHIALSAAGCICLPQMFPRMYMGRSVEVQKKVGISLTVAAFWCVTFILIGMMGVVAPGIEGDPQAALFDLARNTGNVYLLSLTYIVLIAAAMGTLDITLLSLSTIVTMDFMDGILNRKKIRISQPDSIRMSRYIIVLLASLCFLMVNFYDRMIIELALASYEYAAQLFPLLIYALYAEKRDSKVAMAGISSGILLTALLNLTGVDCRGFVPGFLGMLFNSLVIFAAHSWRKKGLKLVLPTVDSPNKRDG